MDTDLRALMTEVVTGLWMSCMRLRQLTGYHTFWKLVVDLLQICVTFVNRPQIDIVALGESERCSGPFAGGHAEVARADVLHTRLRQTAGRVLVKKLPGPASPLWKAASHPNLFTPKPPPHSARPWYMSGSQDMIWVATCSLCVRV